MKYVVFILVLFGTLHGCSLLGDRSPRASKSIMGNPPQLSTMVRVDDQRLVCELKSQKQVYKVGDTLDVSVGILNKSRRTIYLVGSVDGSEARRRYPHVYFTVSGPENGFLGTAYVTCPNFNGLRIEDFVQIQPGGSFDPYMQVDHFGYWPSQLMRYPFRKSGTYTVTFFYSTESTALQEWWTDPTAEIAYMLKQVPRVNLSCAVTVRVED